jgi:hypothetical protein
MHIHDFSEIKTTDGKLTFQDQLQGMLKYGFSWPQEVNAQENFISRLQQGIDQRSSLLRNFTLPDVEVTVPFILIGSPGIRVILPTREHGIFRAKEGQWLIQSRNGFRPAKENLLLRTQLYVRATQKFLSDQGFKDVKLDGMLVGLHPGMHVDTINPAVRVIQSDAIRRFGPQWSQEPETLSPEQIYQIVSIFKRIGEPDPEVEERTARKTPIEPREDQFAKSLEPLQKTFNFDTKQWIVLGVLVGATVLVLLIFMLFILMSL